MIRPRTLAITPLMTIGGVAAILVGAALCLPASDPYDCDYPAEIDVIQDFEEPAADVLTVAEFPRHFSGAFMWDGDTDADRQFVGLDVQEISEIDELIVATGRGTYNTTYRNIDFSFRIEANPETGEFTMWESNPNVASGFVTQGRHEATFVDSLSTVSARWVGDNGQNGTLQLNAASNSTRVGSLDLGQTHTPVPSDALALEGGVRMEKRFVGGSSNCVRSNSDQVKVHYSGWNEDGIFDDSWKRGNPATFRPTHLIKGWTIALHEMCVGDFARVWIPASHAYGEARAGVPAGDLVFDIEVLDITH